MSLKDLFDYKDLKNIVIKCITVSDMVNLSVCSKNLQECMNTSAFDYIKLLDMKQTKISDDPDIASVFVLKDKKVGNIFKHLQKTPQLPAVLFKDYDIVVSYKSFEYVYKGRLDGLITEEGIDYTYSSSYAAFTVLKPSFYKHYDKWADEHRGSLEHEFTLIVSIDFEIGEDERKDLIKYQEARRNSDVGNFIVSKFKHHDEYIKFIEVLPKHHSSKIIRERKESMKYIHCIDTSLTELAEIFLEMGIVKKDEPVLIYHPKRDYYGY